MSAKPTLALPHAVAAIAAALSAVIAIGLLTAVTGLFQRDGTPFERRHEPAKASSPAASGSRGSAA